MEVAFLVPCVYVLHLHGPHPRCALRQLLGLLIQPGCCLSRGFSTGSGRYLLSIQLQGFSIAQQCEGAFDQGLGSLIGFV